MRGMTLIELLVAITVAILVFTASVSVYLAVTSSLRRQQDRRQGTAVAALDQIRHDLACCAQATFSNTPPFSVGTHAAEAGAPGFSSLAFFMGGTPGPEDDFSRFEVKRVQYSVSSGGALIRESQTLWGTDALAPATSNVVLEGVMAWEVSVLADSDWTNRWVSSARCLIPRAARLRLDWRTAATTETARVDVFIPAGSSF